MASAHPDSNGYEPMDLDSWLEGNLFAALANDEWGRIVRSPSRMVTEVTVTNANQTSSPPHTYASPRQLQQPFVGEERAANALPTSDVRRPMKGRVEQPQTYAAVAQQGINSPRQRQQQQVPPVPQQPARVVFFGQQQQEQRQPGPSQAQSTQHASFAAPSRTSTKTYAEALRSPPAEPQEWPSYVDSFNVLDMHQQVTSGYFPQAGQQILPDTITSNPNFHAGVNDPADISQGWTWQSRTARDRLVPAPRLDTSRLSPFTPSTHLSPASITSPSSSRLSNRRTKQQIMSGNYNYHCHVCRAGFDKKPDLKHHFRAHTPEQLRPYPCPSCAKRFLYPKDVVRHSVVHEAKTLFCPFRSCKQSTKGFSRQDHLDRHLRSQHPVDSAYQSSQPPSQPDPWPQL